MTEILFWALPYLCLLFTYLGAWGYCRYLYPHVCRQMESLQTPLSKDPEGPNAQKASRETEFLLESFPECLLCHRIFTFPNTPINKHHESS